MKKSTVTLNEIKLVGITAITSNTDEMDKTKAKIGQTLERYFGNKLANQIPNRKNPDVTYCVYTKYESDENGQYTYFVGEEVSSLVGTKEDFESLIIPEQAYAKFNVGPGLMPNICIDAWQKIWQMNVDDFGSKRAYIADFEIYDERAGDHQNTILDIYIGIKSV